MTRNSYLHFIDPSAAVAVYTDKQTDTQTHYSIHRMRMPPRHNKEQEETGAGPPLNSECRL